MKCFIIIFSIGVTIPLISITYAESDTKITVDFIGSEIINLQDENRLVRMNVNIENYDPGDGYYFLKISDGVKVIKESEIFPKYKTGGLWSVQIAYLVDETRDNILDEYSAEIYTEFGPKSNKITFSVINSTQNNPLSKEYDHTLQEIIGDTKENNNIKSSQNEFKTINKNTTNSAEPHYVFYGLMDRIFEQIKVLIMGFGNNVYQYLSW